MPHIQINAIKNVFSPEQKREVIEKVTETMVAIEGETMREVTWVTFHEVESGDWAIGGKCLTTEDVHALQKG